MKPKILFIERKPHEFYSIEKVFQQLSESLNSEKFGHSSVQMPYLSSFSGMLKNLFSFRRPAADVYHITGDVHYISLILPARKTLLTIHDLNILQTRTGLRRFVLKKLWFDLPIRKLKYLTAISEATKQEIIDCCKCDADKIRVIENPVDEKFFQIPKKEFDAECPNILQIGTAPHKNLPNLIKAVEKIKCRLTIIGKINDEVRDLLETGKIDFVNKFDLDDEEVRNEYQNADIAAFCSTYEGFGLPIIEAQAAQTVVITSNLEPMRGVAGNGAYLCDPHDFLSIEKGIREIIENADLRNELIEKGSVNVERFHPAKIAAKYEELYAEMLSAEN